MSIIDKLIPKVKVVHDASLLPFSLISHFTGSQHHSNTVTFVSPVKMMQYFQIDIDLQLCSNTMTVVQVKRTEGVSSTDIVGRMLMLARDNNRFSEVCYTQWHALLSTQQ